MIRPAMILISLLAMSLSLTLFVVKYQVQDLEGELVAYNRSITDDRQAIHVLKAEWSHLNQPARLRDLAERYLG
ncbi:MAG: energy transducer TonB, partial [Alphaproteobacteria bacterium]|nr:energy transducer TonB [Alphaproteobacteria bacterium]